MMYGLNLLPMLYKEKEIYNTTNSEEMKSFTEYTGKEVVLVFSLEEAHIIGEALDYYCVNHKRLQKAKKLSYEYNTKVEAF